MSGRFAGKVAVVTGAASGIGAETARELHREGAAVAAGDIDAAGLEALQAELGDRIAVLTCDVRREEELAALVAAAVESFGRLDVGFNIAGGGETGMIVDADREGWQFTLDLCLTGVFYGVKHEAKQMIAQGDGGAIVNVASMNSVMPVMGCAAYCCAKAGVVMLTQAAALELGEHGIRVNAVSPGHTKTPMTADVGSGVTSAYLEQTPLSRIGTVEDIAASQLFLASDDAGFVSGVNLLVDGGFTQATHFDLRLFPSGPTEETS